MCHRNIVSSNHNKIIRAHHILYIFISDYIKQEHKKYTVYLLH